MLLLLLTMLLSALILQEAEEACRKQGGWMLKQGIHSSSQHISLRSHFIHVRLCNHMPVVCNTP